MHNRYEGLRHTQIVDHSVPILESDAVVQPEVYQDRTPPDAVSIAADGFKQMLDRMHPGKVDAKKFATVGYAALWHMDPAILGGLSQKQVAKKIGVRSETFCRAVNDWTLAFGIIGKGMSPRPSTLDMVRKGSSFFKGSSVSR